MEAGPDPERPSEAARPDSVRDGCRGGGAPPDNERCSSDNAPSNGREAMYSTAPMLTARMTRMADPPDSMLVVRLGGSAAYAAASNGDASAALPARPLVAIDGWDASAAGVGGSDCEGAMEGAAPRLCARVAASCVGAGAALRSSTS